MSRIIIIATIFAVIGLIFGLNMRQTQPEMIIPPISKKTDDTLEDLLEANRIIQARLTTLETQQKEEQTSRLALSTEIQALKNELKQVDTSTQIASINQSAPDNLNETATPAPNFNSAIEDFGNNKQQVLTALGIDASITDRIEQREEKLEMDRLYLRNTAIREGWFGTEKYFEKTQDLDDKSNVYREELGDANYDRYLFNSNQSNRISVLSVISNSPAEVAGMQPGDVVYQYDHKAVFSWSDLTKATTDGEPGQSVSMVIKRNKELIELFVPRGPLGIRLESIKVDPNS